MERKYYKFMKVLSSHSNDKENYLILQIFPNSSIHDHLVDKLSYKIERLGYFEGLFSFYDFLDKDNKEKFEAWIEAEMAKVPEPVN